MRRELTVFAILTAVAVAAGAVRAEIPASERRSGYAELSPDTKAMQDDDTQNPGMLSVLDGEALWKTKAGQARLSCADCHGDAESKMKGVAARYPAYDPARKAPVDLEQRINICRAQHQKAPAYKAEDKDLLALSAYIGRQSRRMPIAAGDDARLKPFVEAGQKLFSERQGQLNLSCAQCHDERWGKHVGSSVIPQAHPTGYPIYRLEWQRRGLAAAAAAQLHERDASAAVRLRRAGERRARACSRHALHVIAHFGERDAFDPIDRVDLRVSGSPCLAVHSFTRPRLERKS
jgi:L-cysteine S-thiosulfotransferase